MKTRMGIIKKWITLVLCAAVGANVTLIGVYIYEQEHNELGHRSFVVSSVERSPRAPRED